MPVINHDVHPSTVQGLNHHYGCWNLPEYLDHAMSNRCRYDMSLKDRYCADCVHRGKGEAYEESVRQDGRSNYARVKYWLVRHNSAI